MPQENKDVLPVNYALLPAQQKLLQLKASQDLMDPEEPLDTILI